MELSQHSTKLTVQVQCIFKVYLSNQTTLLLTRNLLEARVCLFWWVGGWIFWKYRYTSQNLRLWLDNIFVFDENHVFRPETFCLDRWLAGFPKKQAISAPTTTRVGSKAFFGVILSKLTTLLLMRMLFCGQKLLVWMGGWVAGFSKNIVISAPN